MTEALYDRIGVGYSNARRPDPRIAAQIHGALAGAKSVVNVGAGTGSYEPGDRGVAAVEPSIRMVRQRTQSLAPAVLGIAEQLPLRTRSVDAAMGVLTIHHWQNWRAGVREMRRVARDTIVLLTVDPEHTGFWLTDDYFPEIRALDRRTLPSLSDLAEWLGGAEIRDVLVPHDCTDGFLGAYWRRPENYLDASLRGAISVFSKISGVAAGLARLSSDLESGRWKQRHADLIRRTELDVGYRLVIAR